MAEEAWEGFLLARAVGPAKLCSAEVGATGQKSEKLGSKSRMLLPIFIMVSVLFFRIEIIWHVLGKSLLFPFSCTFAYAWEKQNMHTLKLNWLHLLSSAYCMRIILYNSIVFSLFGFQVLKLGLF